MKLPQKLPGTFKLTKKNETDQSFSIAYHFDCYVQGMKFDLFHSKEIIIKQFLFTESEIEDDLNFQLKVI